MREYVRRRKREIGLTGREIFVPQSYEPGQEGQVDWFAAARPVWAARFVRSSFRDNSARISWLKVARI